jgi:hypothetical protein
MKNITYEVKETEEDFKDLLLKQHIYIKLSLISLVAIVLVANGRLFRIGSYPTSTIIIIVLIMITAIIAVIFGTRSLLIKGFKEGMNTREELYNYKLIFAEDTLTIDRKDKLEFHYDHLTIKQSKKTYFIFYPANTQKKQVCLINKAKCPQEVLEKIENIAKKQ